MGRPLRRSSLGILELKNPENSKEPFFKYYYYPGWHSPTGLLEIIISGGVWEELGSYIEKSIKDAAFSHQKIIEDAAHYAHHYISTQFDIKNKDRLSYIKSRKTKDDKTKEDKNLIYIEHLKPEILYKLWEATESVIKEEFWRHRQKNASFAKHFWDLYISHRNFEISYNLWNIIADDAYTSSIHRGSIAPYYQGILEIALGKKVKIVRLQDSYQILLSEDMIKFEYGDATMTEANKKIATNSLEPIVKMLFLHPPSEIILRGHTDTKLPRGETGNYNVNLSEKRARFVKDELLGELGLNKDRIKIARCGAQYTRANGNSETDHAANRRVELRFRFEQKLLDYTIPEPPEAANQSSSQKNDLITEVLQS